MVRPGRPKMSPTKSIRKGPNPLALNKIDGTTHQRGRRTSASLTGGKEKGDLIGRLEVIAAFYL